MAAGDLKTRVDEPDVDMDDSDSETEDNMPATPATLAECDTPTVMAEDTEEDVKVEFNNTTDVADDSNVVDVTGINDEPDLVDVTGIDEASARIANNKRKRGDDEEYVSESAGMRKRQNAGDAADGMSEMSTVGLTLSSILNSAVLADE